MTPDHRRQYVTPDLSRPDVVQVDSRLWWHDVADQAEIVAERRANRRVYLALLGVVSVVVWAVAVAMGWLG